MREVSHKSFFHKFFIDNSTKSYYNASGMKSDIGGMRWNLLVQEGA